VFLALSSLLRNYRLSGGFSGLGLFALPRARVVKADRVGREGSVVRAFLEGEDGGRLKAVCFRAKDGPLAELLLGARGLQLHLVGHLRADRWNDQVSAGFQIVDAARA
jgi:single-stranded-DNA-specific exonuclease